LDAHFFARALAAAAAAPGRVAVIEDVDQILHRMEPEEFFGLLDFTLERNEGFVWFCTTRHPSKLPKSHLIRPGRMERMIRVDPPDASLRRALWIELLVPHFSSIERSQEEGAAPAELDEATLADLVTKSEGLVQAHFEELRRVSARLRMEGRQMEFMTEAESFISDQVLTPDRSGGASDSSAELQTRLDQADARTLLAAMDMADVLKRVMKKVIADAFEDAQMRFASGETPTAQ
jgi:SpoVK/Ycf46/Vps4 family AAA+-type ATPase